MSLKIPYSNINFPYASVLLTGHEFDYTVMDFIGPWHWYLVDFNVMFSQASVILFTGGVCVWQTPPGQTPPGKYPQVDTPQADTPLGRDPPGQTFPKDGYCSRRYASYWNAFLFEIVYRSLYGSEASLCT